MQKTKLLRQFNALEVSRVKLMDDLKKLEKGSLQFKPNADKWSVNQVLNHLQFSERASITYATKKMQGGKSVHKTGLSATVRSEALSLFLRSGYKWKAPAVLAAASENLPFEEVLQRWNETRVQMKSFLENLPEDLISREIYKHPRAGRLNVIQMMQFFQDHFNHHLPQINRLKKEITAMKGNK
ncbi:MAG: DinB family protein [Chitinophagaceae bacterium]|nr:DinB family protein [Chitinophagaceae bacterium]